MGNEVVLPDEFSKADNAKNSCSVNGGDPLWNLLKEGNDVAFEKIFKLYYPSLLNYGLRFNKDEEEIKDCIQILFLTIWERKQFLGSLESIRNYLLASLRRLILKRKKTAPLFVELESGESDTDSEESSFHIELSVEVKMIQDQTLRENIDFLQNAIQNLPDRQKEALYLKFYNNQSFADIAAVMDISTRAVYKLIYKALDSLNKDLAPHSKNVPFVINVFLSLIFAADPELAYQVFPLTSILK